MPEATDQPNGLTKKDVEEATQKLKDLSVSLFKTFLELEAILKESAEVCVTLGQKLEAIKELNITEQGDSNVKG